ncbi:MAG: alpha/beta hydrolase [Alphaproteobacteria bacterium]|nr:alpha/beta hydrolase [Alphaproteobacteria bacterium]
MIDNEKIEAVLAQMGRPKKVPRPHRHFDGEYVDAPTGKIAYTAEGIGPVVLLVHGWDGSPRDLQDIATALSRAGARVVALDMPAHGLSDGEKVTPEDAAAAILAVAAREGPFECVIAHSFGCPSTVLALEGGLKTASLVFFAPPLRQIDQFRRLGGRMGLDAEEIEEIISRLRAQGSPMDRMDLGEKAKSRSEPLLIIHSDDDEMTPVAGARELAKAWPKAKLLEVEGLGHNLTMRDPAMVAATVRFAVG